MGVADSPESATHVNALYQQVLGRSTNATELAAYQADLLTPGATLSSVLANLQTWIAASPEAVNDIQTVYQQVLRRSGGRDEVAPYLNALATGQSLAQVLGQVRSTLATSAEAQADIQDVYEQVLGRDTVGTEMTDRETELINNQTLAGMRLALAKTPTGQADIQDIYEEVLGRPADPDGLTAYTTHLGTDLSLSQVRVAIAASSEAAQGIQSMYWQELGRAASNPEISAAQDALGWGVSRADLRAPLAYSTEAATRIDDVYEQVLGRDAGSSELPSFENALATGQSLSQVQGEVRSGLAISGEATVDIQDIYWQVLGRAASGPEVADKEGQLAAGRTLAQIRTDVANSPETAGKIATLFYQTTGAIMPADVLSRWQGALATGGSQQALVTIVADAENALFGISGASSTFDPATDLKAGWAPAGTTLTLVSSDGTTLATGAARNLLAELPVYVTMVGGQAPVLVLQDGRHVAFDDAIELANYLDRTAQSTVAADPGLGGAYQATTAWLNQVDQPVLQAVAHYSLLAQYDGQVYGQARAVLDQTAAALALQIAATPAAQRQQITQKVQSGDHQTEVTVTPGGQVSFHDIDPGIAGIVETVGTIVLDALAVAFPEIFAYAAAAVNLAESGQSFANGQAIGGVLDLASSVSFGLTGAAAGAKTAGDLATAANLAEDAQIVSAAAQVTGGVYGVVQGAKQGNAVGVLAGALEVAAGTASGVGVASDGDLYTTVSQVLGGAGAATSFGASISKGDIEGGLLDSLAPWLANLAAQSVAERLGGPEQDPLEGPGFDVPPGGGQDPFDVTTSTLRYAFNATSFPSASSVTPVQYTVTPGAVNPPSGPNPLDPAGLNTGPVPPNEQQLTASALEIAINGGVGYLSPHNYENTPSSNTGAQLPPSSAGYEVFDVPGVPGRAARGQGRIVVEMTPNGGVYYTNNHYDSFYKLTITLSK